MRNFGIYRVRKKDDRKETYRDYFGLENLVKYGLQTYNRYNTISDTYALLYEYNLKTGKREPVSPTFLDNFLKSNLT